MVKVRQNILVFLSVFAILISVMGLANIFGQSYKTVFAEDAVATSEWDGTTADITLGTGTQEDPYIIETAQQFAKLSELNADTKYNNINVYYKLNANINLKNRPFAGIGETGTPFKANFDGSGLTISNFRYTSSINNAVTTVNVGLFNTIEEGTIQNFAISGATISITRNGTNYGNLNCGVVCGLQTNYSDILNVSVDSAVINVQLNGSLTQVAVGGVIGRVYNNSQLSGASCFGLTITNTISSNITSLEILNTGVIAGTVQSKCHVSKSYCDNTSRINVVSNNSSLASDCYVGGIAGSLAVSSNIQQCYSNFSDLTLTTGSDLTNNIGGLVGYINDASYITNCYAKNNLFSGAISDTNKGANNIGGLIGNAVAEANLYNSGYKFLSYSYIVADSLDTDDFGSAKVGAIIGMLDLSGAPSVHKTTATLQNTYYIAKNSQSLDDYNVTGGNKYVGENVATELSNNNAKNVANFVDFDVENIWRNDLAEQTNEGYPILMGVGNDIIPAEKQTYTITVNTVTVDENGTSAPVAEELEIQEGDIQTLQITVPENHTAEVAVEGECITANLDENNLLTLSNPTSNGVVTITITKASYTITLEIVGDHLQGGTISFASGYTNKVYHGENVYIDIIPNEGYSFYHDTCLSLIGHPNSWDGNPDSSRPDWITNGVGLIKVVQDVTVKVKFIKYYTITLNVLTVDETGTQTTTQSYNIDEGGNYESYQLTVPENYSVSVTTQNSLVSTILEDDYLLYFGRPTGNDTITVTITKASYTVTLAVKDNIGGSVAFADGYTSKVYHGQNIAVDVTVDEGYYFDFVSGISTSIVINVTTQTDSGFMLHEITSDLTVTVKFKKVYTITLEIVTIDENNTPVTTTTLDIIEGSYAEYQLTVPDNYSVSVATQNGNVLTAMEDGNLLVIYQPSGDDTVTVTLQKATYTITLAVSGNIGGSLNFASGYSSTIYHGNSTQVVVAADNGYRFDFETGVAISDNNLVAIQTADGFSVANITSNITITVTFIKTYTISVTVGDNAVGEISFDQTSFGSTLQTTVDEGSQVSLYHQFLTDKDKTHRFMGWYDSQNNLLAAVEFLTITNIAKDYTITTDYGTRYYNIQVTINQPENTNNIVKINNVEIASGAQRDYLQYNQTITLSFEAESSCYLKSVVLDGTTLSEQQIVNNQYLYSLTQNSVLVVDFEAYAFITAYAYSNTLNDLQTYSNDNQQNYVGFVQDTTFVYQTKKFKQTETALVYAVTSEKYVFDGWFDSENFDSKTPLSTNTEYSFSAQDLQTIYAKFSINTYTITFKQTLIDENGTNTTTLDTITADYKGSLELDVPTPQYYNYNNIDSKCGATYDLANQKILVTNILASDTVTITFEKQKYIVTFNVGQGGQIQIGGSQVAPTEIYHGEDLTADILIDEGYRFDQTNGVTVTGTCGFNVTIENITLTNIFSNITVDLEFIKYFTVTINTNDATMGLVGFGGSFANGFTEYFDAGTSFTLYARENDTNAYEFKRWVDENNAEIFTNAIVEITNLQQDYNLTAVFAKIGYTLSVSVTQEVANAGNIVTVNNQTVNTNLNLDGQDYGTNISLGYAEDAGSYLDKIVITGSSGSVELAADQIPGNPYNFALTENLRLEVYYKVYKFNLNLNANKGTLTFDDGTTDKTITAYDTIDVIATPNTGYEFDFISQSLGYYDQTEPDNNGVITLSNFVSIDGSPTTSLNIIANFKIKTYKIIVNYGINGTVTINNIEVNSGTEYTYDYGSQLSLNFVANNEYYLNSVSVNGADVTNQLNGGWYTVSSLQEDLTFDVDFGIKKYSLSLADEFADVTFSVFANGILTTETYFESGTYVEISVNCPAGYICEGFFSQSQLINGGTSYSFYIFEDTSLFARVYAEVTVEQSANGRVTINDSEYGAYGYGSKIPVQIMPNLGYQFVGFEGGVVLESGDMLNVTKAITLKPIFESKQVQVVISSGNHGSINSAISGTYVIGDVLNISASITDTGYHFEGFSGQYFGELENELVTTYTIVAQDAEHGRVEIFANFAIDVFEVIITSNYGGAVSPYGTNTFEFGNVLTIEIEIYDKYQLNNINISPNDFEPILTQNNTIAVVVDKNYIIDFEFLPILWIDYSNMPEGLGTSDKPFIIKTAEELAFIAKAINDNYITVGNQVEYDFAYYKLANDIDLTGKFWTPIGTIESPFNGVFDFNYFKIKNISVIDDVSKYQYDGLFDVIGEYGKIINQFHNYTTLVIFIVAGSVLLVLLVLLAVFIEKRHKKPKRVIVLPPHLRNNLNSKTDNKNINKPDISRLNKK